MANRQSQMGRSGIPLHEAPEHFFDPEMWARLVQILGSRQKALDHISNPGLPTFVQATNPRAFAGSEALGLSTPRLNEKTTEPYELAYVILRKFMDRLKTGELVATGSYRSSVEIVPIPATRWRGLWPYITEDRAEGGGQHFVDIFVLIPSKLVSPAQELLDRCISFLKRRSEEGESRRKVLEKEVT